MSNTNSPLSNLTPEQLETALQKHVSPELQHLIPRLATNLYHVIQANSNQDEASDSKLVDPELAPLLKSLAGENIVTSNAVVSFGSGAQIGDVKVRDIAGRDVIRFNINVFASNAQKDYTGLPTSQFGKYEIRDRIGSGSFSVIHRAYDKNLDRYVALKILHPTLSDNAVFVKMFQKEARIVAKLNHPSIVDVFDMGFAEDRYYLAMRLIEGVDLSVFLKKRLPNFAEALRILRPICKALQYIHDANLIHGDLKPANILLDAKGVYISDFGLAKLMNGDGTVIDVSGLLQGSPPYIAPELWDGKPVSPQSDIYALACITFEILTGTRLFGGRTPAQILRSHLQGPMLSQSFLDQVPYGLEKVLLKALSPTPVQRYESVLLFWENILDLQYQAMINDDGKAKNYRETRADFGEGVLQRSRIHRFSTQPPPNQNNNNNRMRYSELRARHDEISSNGDWYYGLFLGIIGVLLLALIITLLSLFGRNNNFSPTSGTTTPGAIKTDIVVSQPSALTIGGTAYVREGIQGLNLRTGPSTQNQIVLFLAPGTQLVMLEGPIANDGLLWWRVRVIGVEGWVVEDLIEVR